MRQIYLTLVKRYGSVDMDTMFTRGVEVVFLNSNLMEAGETGHSLEAPDVSATHSFTRRQISVAHPSSK